MKFLSHILSRMKSIWSYRNEPEETRSLLSLYWLALLLVLVVVCACTLALGAWELSAVAQSESAAGPATPPGSPPIDTAQLQSTLDAFTERQAQYQQLSQSPAPTIADPSR